MSHDPHMAAVKSSAIIFNACPLSKTDKLVVPTDSDILAKKETVLMWKCRKYQ